MKPQKTHIPPKETPAEFSQRLSALRNRAVKNREKAQKASLPKVNREFILSKMAAQLTADLYHNIPAGKRELSSRTLIRTRVFDLLKSGMDAERVAEQLSGELG